MLCVCMGQPRLAWAWSKRLILCERAAIGFQNGMLDVESIWLFYKMRPIGNTPLDVRILILYITSVIRETNDRLGHEREGLAHRCSNLVQRPCISEFQPHYECDVSLS